MRSSDAMLVDTDSNSRTAQEVFFSLCNPIVDKMDKNMSTYDNILG